MIVVDVSGYFSRHPPAPTPHHPSIDRLQSPGRLTAIGHIELDPKVSTGAPGVVAGCEDDPTDGLDLPDDAGNGRSGQEPVMADHQTSDLHAAEMITERKVFILKYSTGKWDMADCLNDFGS